MTSTHSSRFTFRSAIETLPVYVPGAGGADPKIFKLSSNEVPNPPAPAVAAAITGASGVTNRYPEMYADSFCEALAGELGVEVGNVLAGNGSVAVLELVLRAACNPGDEVVYSWRSFEAYPILAQAAGATSVQVPNPPDGSHDFEAMLAAITPSTKVVMVCTPNNPTGQAATHSQVRDFIEAVPVHVLIVLDEAYVHFDRTTDKVRGLELLRAGGQWRENLVVLRTFSKAYGLAGIRLGYAIGSADLLAPLRSASTPFGVNVAAIQAGIAAVGSEEYTSEVVEQVIAERTRVVDALREQGWDVGEPQGNFYWLPIGADSTEFAREALQSGFTVRPFPEGVRVTIGEPEANDLALALAKRWIDQRVG